MNVIRVEDDILIEITPEQPITVSSEQDGLAGDRLDATVARLGEVSNTIGKVCREVYGDLQTRLEAVAPAEFRLEFGVKLAGELGVPLVAKGSGEATFKVTAVWRPDRS